MEPRQPSLSTTTVPASGNRSGARKPDGFEQVPPDVGRVFCFGRSDAIEGEECIMATEDGDTKKTTTENTTDTNASEPDGSFRVGGTIFKPMRGATGFGFAGGVRPPKASAKDRPVDGGCFQDLTQQGCGVGIIGGVWSPKSKKPH